MNAAVWLIRHSLGSICCRRQQLRAARSMRSVACVQKPFSALAPSETGACAGVWLFATTLVAVAGGGEPVLRVSHLLCIFLRQFRRPLLLSLV